MSWLGDSTMRPVIDAAQAYFDGHLAFYAQHLESGEELGLDADETMPPANLIKLAVLVTAYHHVAEGHLDLDHHVHLRDAERIPGTGVLRYFAPGVSLSFRDLVRLMIAVSDNVATAHILRAVGVDAMHSLMDELGCPNTRLRMPPVTKDGPRGYALSTPRELGSLLIRIARDELVSPQACAEMRGHLASQHYGDQVPRYLPFNFYAADRGHPSPLQIMNKTGFSIGVRTDAALVRIGSGGFVIATMTEGCSDHGFYPEHPGNVLNGVVARRVFEHWYGDQLAELTTAESPLPPLPAQFRRQ